MTYKEQARDISYLIEKKGYIIVQSSRRHSKDEKEFWEQNYKGSHGEYKIIVEKEVSKKDFIEQCKFLGQIPYIEGKYFYQITIREA